MPSFILIHPTVWPQYANVTDRQDRQTDSQTDRPTDRQTNKWPDSTGRANRFWATVCKTVRPMLSVRCLSCLSVLSVCDVRALWPIGWTDQDET